MRKRVVDDVSATVSSITDRLKQIENIRDATLTIENLAYQYENANTDNRPSQTVVQMLIEENRRLIQECTDLIERF